MRWYSVKDYVIPRDYPLFVTTKTGYFYSGEYYGPDREWKLDGIEYNAFIEITHFCIPSPVPIEEWLEMRNINTIGVE